MGYPQGQELTEGDQGLTKPPEAQPPEVAADQWRNMATLDEPDAGQLTAQRSVDKHFGDLEIFEQPARQAVESPPPVAETLKAAPYYSSVKLNLQITNVAEAPEPVQSLDDLNELTAGIGQGLQHVAEETLNYLATPGAVEDSLLQIGPALDQAVNYYAHTPADQILADAQEALAYVGQALEEVLGYPLTPEQRGEYAAAAMPMFMIPGRDGKMIALSEQSGIEVTTATGTAGESIWPKGWSVRGFEGEVEMGASGIFARNFPTVDDAILQDGVFTSMKTVDLNAASYQIPEKLESKLNEYLDKLNSWEGQEKAWGGRRIDPDDVTAKVLQIGIPSGSMTPEQAQIFEAFGKRAKELGIPVRLTVLE